MSKYVRHKNRYLLMETGNHLSPIKYVKLGESTPRASVLSGRYFLNKDNNKILDIKSGYLESAIINGIEKFKLIVQCHKKCKKIYKFVSIDEIAN